MNIHTQLKTLTLLCTIPLFNAFAAQPALPESLRVELASIDALSDHEILCKVTCKSQENAKQNLAKSKQELKKDVFLASHLAQKEVHWRRVVHKYRAIKHEIEACDNPEIKAMLQAQKERITSELTVARKEYDESKQSFSVNGKTPVKAYNYQTSKLIVYQNQAAVLLAQKTKLENTLQQKEAQWQQREQALLAQLSGYQLLVDGEQIEGMPNVPGGVEQKKEHKRRSSF